MKELHKIYNDDFSWVTQKNEKHGSGVNDFAQFLQNHKLIYRVLDDKCISYIEENDLSHEYYHMAKLVTTQDGKIAEEHYDSVSLLKEKLQELKDKSDKDHTLVIIEYGPHGERLHEVRVKDLKIKLEDARIIQFADNYSNSFSIKAYDVYIDSNEKVVRVIGKTRVDNDENAPD